MSSISAVAPQSKAARTAPPPSPVNRHNLAGWLFATPWVVIFLVFMTLPILASLVLSFTDFGIANLANPFNLHFIGGQNYGRLVHDQLFLQAALNTIIVVVIGVPLNV